MRPMRKLRVVLWVIVASLAIPAVLLARKRQERAALTGADVAGVARYGEVPPFALTAQTGKSLTLADLRGSVWVADFIFTSCLETCPMITTRMKNLDRTLQDGAPSSATSHVRLVSFSVDPVVDTPARLAAYAAKYGADATRWQFVTGNGDDVLRVVTQGFKLGVSRVDRSPGVVDIVHANRFVLVDKAAQVRGFYDTESPDDMRSLVADARRLVAE